MSGVLPSPSTQSQATASTIIQFDDVGKSYGSFEVLKNIDLAIAAGEVTVICGPSGSGKSTLLRCINGLERVQTGCITVMGQVLTNATLASQSFRSEIGFVFQKFSLYPHMTVLQNLTFAPRKVRRLSVQQANTRARELLARVDLTDKADAYPGELSGGQQQRVAIMRALAMQPRIMLFDEPTSALDPEMIREVLDVIRDLALTGMTMVVVTHEMGFAKEVANRIVFMERGEIVEATKTDDFFGRSSSPRAQRFLDKVLHH
jgi:ABC-type polar amino acid transport system ATPase subunit